MKYFLSFVISYLLFYSNFLVAQSAAIDSLLLVLKSNKVDTSKVNTLNALSYQSYIDGNYESEMSYAEEAVALAKKINWKKGMASSLSSMGGAFDNEGKFPESLACYFDALKIFKDLNSKPNIAICLGNIGTIYEIQSDYSLALEYYFKALKIVEEFNDKNRTAITLSNIGNIYMEQGDFTKSLGYYFRALKIAEAVGKKRGIAANLVNIGNVYFEKDEHEQALNYYLKALKIIQEIKETNYESVLLGNIGATYDKLGEQKKGLEFYFKALQLNTSLGRKTGISINLSNIGNLYTKQKEYIPALEYYFKALKMDEESGRKSGVAVNLCHIGNVYTKQKSYTLAKEFLARSLTLSKQIMSKSDISNAYARTALLDSAMGNYQSAFLNYKMHIIYEDSLSNEDAKRKATQIAMQYEFDKKQTADSILLVEERKLNELKFADQKTQRNYLYLGLILIVLFAGFIYSRFKIAQKQKLIIEQKEKETQHQKHIIEEKHKEIKDSINYAERIQRSLLASDELLNENLSGSISNLSNNLLEGSTPKNHFVYFKPKDVVSGDFYWASKLSNNNFALITADSTGHGVPGAIMSILNIACLNESIKEGNCDPSIILNETRKKIIDVLKRDGSVDGGKDGMDCNLLVFEPFTNKQKNEPDFTTKVHIASANNPVWIVRPHFTGDIRNVELIEIKADKMPVGKHDKDNISFTKQTTILHSGDMLYTLTDGFPDQFGGEKGKKYMIKKLKETLLKISHLPVDEQHKLLSDGFFYWMGNNEQVDDVTIIGIRI